VIFFSFAHGLVVNLFKAELVDVEVEGVILVADSDTDGANLVNIGTPPRSMTTTSLQAAK